MNSGKQQSIHPILASYPLAICPPSTGNYGPLTIRPQCVKNINPFIVQQTNPECLGGMAIHIVIRHLTLKRGYWIIFLFFQNLL